MSWERSVERRLTRVEVLIWLLMVLNGFSTIA